MNKITLQFSFSVFFIFLVIAFCDIRPFRLENVLSKSKDKVKSYSNYREILDDRNIDLILVATPFNTHAYPQPKNEERITGDFDGVSRATMPREEDKVISIEVQHTPSSEQVLKDFEESILNNSTPASNVVTKSKSAISAQMGLDALHRGNVIKWQ